jgi:hypothetical protein
MPETDSRPGLARRLKRAGLGLCVTALAATAVTAALPAAASAAGTLTVTGAVTVPATDNAGDVYAVLLDPGGNPVSETQVVPGAPTTSGTFVFTGVSAGSYKVYFVDPTGTDDVAPAYLGGATSFQSASSVAVASSASIGSATLAAGGEVSGTITDANTGDTNTSVTANQVGATDPGQSAFWNWYASGSPQGTITTTGSTRSYTIGGLVPGSVYTLQYGFGSATAPVWNTQVYVAANGTVNPDPADATVFKPSATPLTAAFSVPAVGSINGTVTDPGGLANSNVAVEVFNDAGAVIPATVTWSNGAYTVRGLIPGTYKLEFLPVSQVLAPQYYNGAATLATATAINVVSGAQISNINVTLTAGSSVSGTVTAAQGGAPLGGLEVGLIDAQGNAAALTFTNADGTYTLTGVPAGTWYVEFDGGRAYNGQYYATEYYLGKPTLAGAKALAVNAGVPVTGINEALLSESTTAPGLPKISGGSLTGLSTDRVALKFKLAAGSGPAGYLKSFTIKLPKNVSWNKSKLKGDIVIARDTYSEAIRSGRLVITFATGKKTASFQIKAGGITVSRGIENLAKKRSVKSEAIDVAATDTTGNVSSLSFTVKKPH